MLWIEANMNKWNGRHFLDRDNKRRMMEYKGVLFVWDADAEVWDFCGDHNESPASPEMAS